MKTEMICAGFGGQGVLSAGMILINSGMLLGKQVTWYPSYGSEMRGGTANCTVKFSDNEIASPISKSPDILLTMNEVSIDKFENQLKPNGLLLVNSTLVSTERKYREDIRVVKVPATKIAQQLDNPKGANIVMIGALAASSELFEVDELERLVNKYFENKGKHNEKNSICYRAGVEAVRKE